METAGGTGKALNATVETQDNAPSAGSDNSIAEADASVAAAEYKVEKQRVHLAAAEEALANAIAAREGIE